LRVFKMQFEKSIFFLRPMVDQLFKSNLTLCFKDEWFIYNRLFNANFAAKLKKKHALHYTNISSWTPKYGSIVNIGAALRSGCCNQVFHAPTAPINFWKQIFNLQLKSSMNHSILHQVLVDFILFFSQFRLSG
jgi:hypothetical protein